MQKNLYNLVYPSSPHSYHEILLLKLFLSFQQEKNTFGTRILINLKNRAQNYQVFLLSTLLHHEEFNPPLSI